MIKEQTTHDIALAAREAQDEVHEAAKAALDAQRALVADLHARRREHPKNVHLEEIRKAELHEEHLADVLARELADLKSAWDQEEARRPRSRYQPQPLSLGWAVVDTETLLGGRMPRHDPTDLYDPRARAGMDRRATRQIRGRHYPRRAAAAAAIRPAAAND